MLGESKIHEVYKERFLLDFVTFLQILGACSTL